MKFDQFVSRSTGWRTSWWASRRSWRGSPRNWSRPSPRCPDISSSRNGWTLVLTWADLCQNVWILLPPRTDLYWDVWLFLQTWTDFYHPDVPGKSKPCLRRINISFCCHVIIHSVIQWSHKRILSAPRLSEIAVFQKKKCCPKSIYLSPVHLMLEYIRTFPGALLSPATGINHRTTYMYNVHCTWAHRGLVLGTKTIDCKLQKHQQPISLFPKFSSRFQVLFQPTHHSHPPKWN